ncbi:glycoside hydrolase family 25 protein [Aneurinibacillus aneurinilyticus]|uniref:glycoside hydrolase family 25 protein n=1 Tax=Aneurinibacillus aneurinilyticus TaxID=1391 RepID=UPI002E232038|nr:glycoside hydrolase family 25 protein [Aneurinibacillus aneurinilyticus]
MTIIGIDVSHWNGVVDWKKVAASGVNFVFLKASEGTTYVDKTFKTNAANALTNGIRVGAYHYAKFGNVAEAKAEAQHFLRTVSGVKITYPLVLDLEENKKKASKAILTDAAVAFLNAIEKAGYFAMIYAGKSFLETQLDEKRLKPYALWVARYNSYLGRDAGIWQYTDKGKVNGISGNVDMNLAYVDYAALIDKKGTTTPTPPKEEKKLMKTEDANKIIRVLQDRWNASTCQDEKKEMGRLADEVRVAAGMKKVNS